MDEVRSGKQSPLIVGASVGSTSTTASHSILIFGGVSRGSGAISGCVFGGWKTSHDPFKDEGTDCPESKKKIEVLKFQLVMRR